MSGTNSLRRHSRRRTRVNALIVLATCLLAAVALSLAAITSAPTPNIETPEPEPAITELAAALPSRPVYRHSVVNGGVYSAREVAHAIATDAAVADHYRGIDVARLRAESVTRPVMAYMSYRRNGQIYWTKHKVQLQQGETILTGGTNQVRARCGNCISLEPMQPTEEDAPEAVEFDALVPDPLPPSQAPLAARTLPPNVMVPPELENPGLFNGLGFSTEQGGGVPFTAPEAEPGLDPTPFAGDPGVGGPASPPFTPPPTNSPNPVPSPRDGTDPENPLPPVLVELPPGLDPPVGDPYGFDPEDPIDPDQPVDPIPTPEPATLLLVGGGGAGLVLRRWRAASVRRRSTRPVDRTQ